MKTLHYLDQLTPKAQAYYDLYNDYHNLDLDMIETREILADMECLEEIMEETDKASFNEEIGVEYFDVSVELYTNYQLEN